MLILSFLLSVVINYNRLKKESDFTTGILQTAGALILVLDNKGRIRNFNKACEITSGYSSDEVTGRYLYALPFYENHTGSKDSVSDLWNRTKKSSSFENCWVNKDGSRHYISWTTTSLKDESDKNQWIICTGIDITEKRKLEEELLKIKKLESVGLLAGGIAHDFNNILTAILGNISLAKLELEPNHDLVEILAQAEKASIQARNLTNQLLTFSKGGLPVLKPVSIAELVVESANFALRGSNIKPVFNIDDDLWTAKIDQVQIHQVINNLIINAAQAMPDGGILDISLRNYLISEDTVFNLEAGNYIKLTIKDYGIGISKEYLSKIFDPYFTTKKKGHGLGLATSFSIIKNHNGHITVDSELGKGTTFTIYLPALTDRGENTADNIGRQLVRGRGRILVVDDEKYIRQLAHRMLTKLGYEVESAKNGDEGIDMYSDALMNHPFDAVIVDLTIKGHLGGKETIEKLREIDPDITAIVSSGYSNDPVMAHYSKYGFAGVVTKPYNIEDLNDILHKLLQDRRKSSDIQKT
ncbi:response regulator [candidate division KSB1 bacterium]|nr:response regulator [candidate division KSB1 bacterium]